VESELFGHKRGAFSGALADHSGLFRAAAQGTMLLDEIGDLPLPAQAALLRVLQEGEVRPVGGTQSFKVDVRIVAATHRDLEALVARGAFREDLLARLAGFTLRLPPLRERKEDIGLLISALLRRSDRPHITLSAEACEALLAYDWPRNIRELERALARAVLLATSGVIEVEHLGIRADEATHPVEVSREGLMASLEKHAGNVTSVAKQFATSRSQVHRWLRRYGLDTKDYRG
jgi:transcriptional regulator with GAF, ATPase, and Fis domain